MHGHESLHPIETAVASHGLRWIDYQYVGEAAEREHIRKAIEITTQVN